MSGGAGPIGFDPSPFRAWRRTAGLFLDFDGTLSEIVARPELARPRPEIPGILGRLIERYALVAVVSGRPPEQVRRLVPVDGLLTIGLYGLPEDAPPLPPQVVEEARQVAAGIGGARVEEKGSSVAVHYRGAANVEQARRALLPRLEAVARGHELRLMAGRNVLELVPLEVPGKGAVVAGETQRRGLEACLFAGDDRADVDAFQALDQLKRRGLHTVKVAVASGESPDELLRQADVVVTGPQGLAELLETL